MSNEKPPFDPNWDIFYSPFSKRMGENPRMMMHQQDSTNNQVYALTREVVTLQQELHEIRSLLAVLQKDATIVTNTAGDTKRGPGRPKKGDSRE